MYSQLSTFAVFAFVIFLQKVMPKVQQTFASVEIIDITVLFHGVESLLDCSFLSQSHCSVNSFSVELVSHVNSSGENLWVISSA